MTVSFMLSSQFLLIFLFTNILAILGWQAKRETGKEKVTCQTYVVKDS